MTLEGDKQKHGVHNTFRFRTSHPFLEVINPAEPRLRVFNFRATFLFMCTTYRNRFCRLKLLESVEINENPDRSIVTRVHERRHLARSFSPPLFRDLVFVTRVYIAGGRRSLLYRRKDVIFKYIRIPWWFLEEKDDRRMKFSILLDYVSSIRLGLFYRLINYKSLFEE